MVGRGLGWWLLGSIPTHPNTITTGDVVNNCQNEAFQKIVRLAATKRLLNVPQEDMINEAISKKLDLLKSEEADQRNCKNEQMSDRNSNLFFEALQKEHSLTIEKDKISPEDIATGTSLYMIGKHCPEETMKLGQFLLQLAKEESPPTFILATVNTLTGRLMTTYHKLLLGRIYQVLEDIFGFHLGRILMATSSPEQITALQDQYLPFLNQSDQFVQRCISGVSYKDVFAPIQGSIYIRVFHICNFSPK